MLRITFYRIFLIIFIAVTLKCHANTGNPNSKDEVESLNEENNRIQSYSSEVTVLDSIEQKQYILLKRRGFERSIMAKEYDDLINRRKSVGEIISGIIIRKFEPTFYNFKKTVEHFLENISEICQSSCACALTSSWILGIEHKVLSHCDNKSNKMTSNSKNITSNSIQTIAFEITSFFSNAVKSTQQFAFEAVNQLSLLQLDIAHVDTSLEDVEVEDQLFFGIMHDAFDSHFHKFMDSVIKVSYFFMSY